MFPSRQIFVQQAYMKADHWECDPHLSILITFKSIKLDSSYSEQEEPVASSCDHSEEPWVI
jgi:hypothetical protein